MGVLANKQVTVTTAATLVIDGNDDGCYVNVRTGAKVVYIGDSSVSISNGYLLDEDESISLILGPNEGLYAIVEADTGTLYFLATMNQ